MRNGLTWKLAGILFMTVSGIALTFNLKQRYDVLFGDEMTYLYSGLTYTFPPDPKLAQWGSLYAAWYRFLGVFTGDTLDQFYLNWQLLILLSGVLLFLYLYLRRSGFLVSLFCALCFQFSSLNVLLDPRISAFTLCLILAGLCVVQSRRWSAQAVMLITALTALVCAYVRPEFYVTMLIACGIALGLFFVPYFRRRGEATRMGLVGLAGVAALIVVMLVVFGNPLSEGNRSFDAFVQHFSINYNTWHNHPVNIPIVDQFRLIADVFGSDVQSMSDAFRAEPGLVIRHFWTNFVHTLREEVRVMTGVLFDTPLTYLTSPYRKWILAALFAVVAGLLINWPATFRQWSAGARKLTSRELALFLLLFPSLVSVILVYPRIHYLYFHAVGLLTVAAFFLKNIQIRPIRTPVRVAGLTALMAVWVIYQSVRRQVPAPTPVADNIRFIRSLSLRGTVSSLEREWYRVFLYGQEQSPRWVRVELYPPNSDFTTFLREHEVNFILMTRDMQKYFARDSGFSAFLTRAESDGFVRVKTPEPGSYLLIRQDLLAKGALASRLF
ncbi:hypothetical protein [Larkinella soli]|uniref:hypothetical protein n=1 Tax=Larkinella soli TaxID=1770527 RepID=UPI000FFB61DA|nr:hypothetical protein [Larkinella soli]